MKKRIGFWIAIFALVFFAAIYVTSTLLNSAKSVWIGTIAATVGILYSLIKVCATPKRLQFPENNKKNFVLLAIISIVIFSTIAVFLEPKIAVCFALGAFLGVLSDIFATVFFKKTNFLNTISAQAASTVFTLSLSLLGVSILIFLFKDPVPLFGFALGSTIAGVFGHRSENDALFDTFSAVLVSAIALGALTLNLMGAYLPMVLGAFGIFAIIFSSFFVYSKKHVTASFLGIILETSLFLAASFFLIKLWFGEIMGLGLFWAMFTGVLAVFMLAVFSKIKQSALKHLLQGVLFCVLIILTFLLSYGMQSYPHGCLGIITSIFCAVIVSGMAPIYIAGLSVERDVEVIAKSFAETTGILSTLAVLLAFVNMCNIDAVEVLNPFIFISLIFGVVLAFMFFDIHKSSLQDSSKRVLLTVLATIAPVCAGIFTNLEATMAILLGATVSGICLGVREKNLPATFSAMAQIRLMSIISLVFGGLFHG